MIRCWALLQINTPLNYQPDNLMKLNFTKLCLLLNIQAQQISRVKSNIPIQKHFAKLIFTCKYVKVTIFH